MDTIVNFDLQGSKMKIEETTRSKVEIEQTTGETIVSEILSDILQNASCASTGTSKNIPGSERPIASTGKTANTTTTATIATPTTTNPAKRYKLIVFTTKKQTTHAVSMTCEEEGFKCKKGTALLSNIFVCNRSHNLFAYPRYT